MKFFTVKRTLDPVSREIEGLRKSKGDCINAYNSVIIFLAEIILTDSASNIF